jgi:thiamine biosynthesis lipoprotein
VTARVAFSAMGTVVSVAVHGSSTSKASAACQHLARRIEELELVLSRWREESALARRRRGVAVDDVALREVEVLASLLEQLSGGAFVPRDTDGPDLDGIAKGWIVERAALEAFATLSSSARISVAAGGDVWVRGEHQVGVAHPSVRGALVALLRVNAGGVATSGTSERGEHLRAPEGRLALAQATVCAPVLWLADGLATALVVAGDELIPVLTALPGVGWFVIDRDGRRRWGGAIEVVYSA